MGQEAIDRVGQGRYVDNPSNAAAVFTAECATHALELPPCHHIVENRVGQKIELPIGPKSRLGWFHRDERTNKEAEHRKHKEETAGDCGILGQAVQCGLPADAAILQVS